MSQKAFALTAGVVFLLIALGHLLRVVFGVSFVVQDIPIPVWASGVAVSSSRAFFPTKVFTSRESPAEGLN